MSVELSLRTECKLRLKRGDSGNPSVSCEGGPNPASGVFPFATIAAASLTGDAGLITLAALPANRSPLTLQFA